MVNLTFGFWCYEFNTFFIFAIQLKKKKKKKSSILPPCRKLFFQKLTLITHILTS